MADLGLHAQGGKNPVVTSLTTDSREVTQGALFCALPGTKVHGASFAGKVIADGAAA
ncbi:MAG: UDP-N-acetylmuramoyl-L-alanyl-D-glutamate--2,6-diaminopimelate ligase, partial [Rhodobacteraceae bacterium]|nr:UDP-N-acetylmuramoyl-L-alanyl-D-glutamate--2,6-diaminopimelate ligase [Paracoccaceae bacterium]